MGLDGKIAVVTGAAGGIGAAAADRLADLGAVVVRADVQYADDAAWDGSSALGRHRPRVVGSAA